MSTQTRGIIEDAFPSEQSTANTETMSLANQTIEYSPGQNGGITLYPNDTHAEQLTNPKSPQTIIVDGVLLNDDGELLATLDVPYNLKETVKNLSWNTDIQWNSEHSTWTVTFEKDNHDLAGLRLAVTELLDANLTVHIRNPILETLKNTNTDQ